MSAMMSSQTLLPRMQFGISGGTRNLATANLSDQRKSASFTHLSVQYEWKQSWFDANPTTAAAWHIWKHVAKYTESAAGYDASSEHTSDPPFLSATKTTGPTVKYLKLEGRGYVYETSTFLTLFSPDLDTVFQGQVFAVNFY
ncbi:uncharacterized protein LOC142182109 isoform X2 [Nicotiana tabacum]